MKSPFFFPSFPSIKWKAVRKIISLSQPFFFALPIRKLISGGIFMFDNLLGNLVTSDSKSSLLPCVDQGCPYWLIFTFRFKMHPSLM